MIETLARKRTNAVALAVLAALVAALFVVLQSVSAASCVANPNISLGLGESCDIDVAKVHKDATGLAKADADATSVGVPAASADTTDADTVFTVVAAADPGTDDANIGTETLNITAPDDTNTPADADTEPDVVGTIDVTVVGFGIKSLAVKDDSDNVVSAGPQVTLVATLRSASASPASNVRLTVPTTGLSIETDASTGATSQSQTKAVTAGGTQMIEFTVNTAGAPADDYVLTFTADQDGNFATKDGSSEANKQDTQTLTLTVGEPGTGLASATLSLGNSAEDLPFTDANEAVAETGSASAATGKINLVVEVFDSLGGKANSSAINQIIVIAPGGTITSSHLTGDGTNTAGGDSSATLSQVDATPADTAETAGDVGQKTGISVSKTNKKPGTVTVYAIVSGPGGAARTEDVTLTFSGPAASMSIADATESLLSVNVDGDDEGDTVDEDEYDTIKLVVTAEDAGGNSTAPPTSQVSIVITDPDGKRKGSSVIGYTQPTKVGTKYLITLTGKGTATAPLAAGNWTLTAKSGKLEAEATFAVAGPPADVAVSASSTSSDTIGDVITVTASVTDKDGNTVSDGTSVVFSVSTNTGLAAIGTGHSGKASKNGEAAVKYAVVGAGNSVVSATAGDATGVVVIVSTAGTAVEEEAPAEPALSDFSNGGSPGLTSYNGPDSSASELFTLLEARGASALWLWNGSNWVLYATVDGSPAPGSTDFMVVAGDVVFISGQ